MTELMKETEDIASQRRALKEMHELLFKASEIVNEVRMVFYAFFSLLLTMVFHFFYDYR
jgi:hypothetical protein